MRSNRHTPRSPIGRHLDRAPRYVGGRSIEELEAIGLPPAKLASNENALGPPPAALEAAQRALERVHRYPDPSYGALREAIARHCDVPPSAVVVANGSDELIGHALLVACQPGDVVAIPAHSFGMYHVVAHAHRLHPVEAPLSADGAIDLDALAEVVVREAARVVFVCNPLNPTGTIVGSAAFERFLDAIGPEPLVVVDEAYVEYARGADLPEAIGWTQRRPHTLVLRTFSKAWGLAGLRIGYGIAGEPVARALEAVRMPFNVNRVATAAALAALQSPDHLDRVVAHNREQRAWLAARFTELGLGVRPSYTNFLFVDLGRLASPVVAALWQRGIMVRDMAGYGFANHVRITVGTTEENRRVVQALREVLRGAALADSEDSSRGVPLP